MHALMLRIFAMSFSWIQKNNVKKYRDCYKLYHTLWHDFWRVLLLTTHNIFVLRLLIRKKARNKKRNVPRRTNSHIFKRIFCSLFTSIIILMWMWIDEDTSSKAQSTFSKRKKIICKTDLLPYSEFASIKNQLFYSIRIRLHEQKKSVKPKARFFVSNFVPMHIRLYQAQHFFTAFVCFSWFFWCFKNLQNISESHANFQIVFLCCALVFRLMVNGFTWNAFLCLNWLYKYYAVAKSNCCYSKDQSKTINNKQ